MEAEGGGIDMKEFTLTYKHRGTNALLTAKVFCDSLVGAEKALLEWEGLEGHDIVITSATYG